MKSLEASLNSNRDEIIQLQAVRLADGAVLAKWVWCARWGNVWSEPSTLTFNARPGTYQTYYRRQGRKRWFKLAPPSE